MELWISHEDGNELVNSQATAEASAMPTEGTRTTHEGNTKMWIFIVVYTRRTHDGYTTSYWEYDAFELGHK